MRSYIHTFDPVKEIPEICAELAEGQSRLKSLLASLDSDLISKRQHRDSLKAEFDRKVSQWVSVGVGRLCYELLP